MVEEMILSLRETDAAAAICQFVQFTKKPNFVDSAPYIVSQINSAEALTEMMYGVRIDSGPWCKLFKREAIGDCRFDVNKEIGEDFDFICTVLTGRNLTISHSNKALYGYRAHTGSIMGVGYSSKYIDYLNTVKQWRKRLTMLYPRIDSATRYRAFGVASDCIGKIGANVHVYAADYKYFNKELKRHSFSVMCNPRSSGKNRVLAFLYLINTQLTSWVRCKMSKS